MELAAQWQVELCSPFTRPADAEPYSALLGDGSKWGISITYAMRDMLLGESITGLFRFIESLLIAATIAGGTAQIQRDIIAERLLGHLRRHFPDVAPTA